MALSYKVWTEEETETRNLVPDGNYPFEITAVYAKKTKGGLDKDGKPKQIWDMLELSFSFMDAHGGHRNLKDWLVLMPTMDWKLRHLADTTKNLDLYEAQELDCKHLVGKKGVFTLGNKDYVSKDGDVKKVNYVKDYVKESNVKPEGNAFLDDDIPL